MYRFGPGQKSTVDMFTKLCYNKGYMIEMKYPGHKLLTLRLIKVN